MRDYVLLTDSCCDLSAEMAAELGVEILPLSLEMGGKSYRNYPDGRDIGFQEFTPGSALGSWPPPPP